MGKVSELEIRPQSVPEMRLITAKSYLIDRIMPQCETVILPARSLPAGRLCLSEGDVRFEPKKRRRLSAIVPQRTERVPEGRWAFEMRLEDPENWAHFLNDHLPLFFHVTHVTGRDPETALLLLPSDAPGYLARVAKVFGLECWETDAPVEGEGVAAELTPYISNRTERHEWTHLPFPQEVMEGLLDGTPSVELPEKVFLTRQKQRALSNHDQVEAFLAERGFKPVLPEALPPEDQFRLFLQAKDMVAASGAGLAPLLYTTPPRRGPERLIELQPCGHMSTVYREMAHLVGCRFVGVRGRIKPEYVKPAYDFDTLFRKFSQDSYHVDLESLEEALAL